MKGFIITILFLLAVPSVSAEKVFTCYDTNYQGEQFKCRDREPFTENYHYLIEDKITYYKITSDGDTCKLPKNRYWSYDFGIYKISPKIIVPSLSKLINVAVPYNSSVYYIPILNLTSAVKKCGKLFWDEKFIIKDNGTHYGYDELEVEIKNFSYFPIEEGTFKVVNNVLSLYAKKTWFLSANYPITLIYDSLIYNSTESGGWNVSFDNTTLNENEDIIANRNLSGSLFQEAYSYYTMDRNIHNNGVNATHILNFNESNGNGLISGTVDEIGPVNRSMRFTDPDFITIPEVSYTMGVGSTFIFQAKKDNAGAVDILIGRSSTPGENYISLFSDGNLYMETSQSTDFVSGSYTQDTNWHDYAISCRLTTCVVYVDLVDTTTDGTVSGAAIILNQLGRRGTDTAFLNGTEDNVGTWRRNLSFAEIVTITNGSNYLDSNITAPVKGLYNDAGAEKSIINITINQTCGGNGTSNIFINKSTDASAWTMELLQSELTSGLINVTPLTFDRYSHVIWNSNNTGGGLCSLHELELIEGFDTQVPNITFMSPLNNTFFDIDITDTNGTNVNFTLTCVDNVDCQNATLYIYYANGTFFNFSRNAFPSFWNLTVGVGFIGTLEDTLFSDNIYLTIQEESVDDSCLQAEFNWTGATGEAGEALVVLEGYYTGGASHVVGLGLRNFTSGEVFNFANATKEVSDVVYVSPLVAVDDFIDSYGNATLVLDHEPGACFSNHYFLIDEIKAVGLAGASPSINISNGETVGIDVSIPLGTFIYTYQAFDTSGNSRFFELGNFTITVREGVEIILTMSDMNIYSFKIPIISNLLNWQSDNYIVIYRNGDYYSTNKTNGRLTLDSAFDYKIAFLPSKKHWLSSPEILLDNLATYYKVLITLAIIFSFILLLKKIIK